MATLVRECGFVPNFVANLSARKQGFLFQEILYKLGKFDAFRILRIRDGATMYIGPIVEGHYCVYLPKGESLFSQPRNRAVLPLLSKLSLYGSSMEPPRPSLTDPQVFTRDPTYADQGGPGNHRIFTRENSYTKSDWSTSQPVDLVTAKSIASAYLHDLHCKTTANYTNRFAGYTPDSDAKYGYTGSNFLSPASHQTNKSDINHDYSLELISNHLIPHLSGAFAASHYHANKAYLWHCRLGHLNYNQLQRSYRLGKLPGAHIPDSHWSNLPICHTCIKSTAYKFPIPKRTLIIAIRPFQLVSVDLLVGNKVRGINGCYDVLFYIDHYSDHPYMMLVKDHKGETLAKAHKLFITHQVIARGLNPQHTTLLSDTEASLEFGEFMQLISDQGTQRRLASKGLHAFKLERTIRTVVTRTRKIILQHDVPQFLWDEFMKTGTMIIAWTPGKQSRNNMSPYEILNGRMPPYKRLHVPGTKVYVCKDADYLRHNKKNRLDAIASPGIYVGYDIPSDSHRVYVLGTKHILRRRDVYFIEDLSYAPWPSQFHNLCQRQLSRMDNPLIPNTKHLPDESKTTNKPSPPSMGAQPKSLSMGAPPNPSSMGARSDSKKPLPRKSARKKIPNTPFGMVNSFISDNPMLTGDTLIEEHCSNDNSYQMLASYTGFYPLNCRPGVNSGVHSITNLSRKVKLSLAVFEKNLTEEFAMNIPTPKTYKEAVSGKHANRWIKAIDAELNNMRKHQVWEVVPCPKGRKLINTVWVFKVKQLADGRVDKLKGRLCVQGFTQVYGIDYWDTFSPVVRYDTLRTMLAVAASRDLELIQGDVPGAFLKAELKEDEQIYIKPPKGLKLKPGYVLKLKKAMYGLKQASKAFYDKLKGILLKKGFRISLADPCLFYKDTPNGRIYVISFVDDLAIAGKKSRDLDLLLNSLSTSLDIEFDAMKWFLGMRITRNRPQGCIYLDQERYILDVLKRFNMQPGSCKPRDTPLPSGIKISRGEQTPADIEFFKTHCYGSIIGSLMYAAISTCKDGHQRLCLYAVSILV